MTSLSQMNIDGTVPLELTVEPSENGMRLDQFVRQRIGGISRGSVLRLLERKLILVEGRAAVKGLQLITGQRVLVAAVARSEAPTPQPELPLDILLEQPTFVVINKAAGLPCHPLVPGETDTVANALVARYPECSKASPQAREGGLVHRLDFGTSGVLIAARTPQSYGRLRGMFSSHRVEKKYLALVAGRLESELFIDAPLRTMRQDPSRMEVAPLTDAETRQEAATQVRPKENFAHCTLVEVLCYTGRRHQVRVHLAYAGYPLVGDEQYGGPAHPEANGAFLHAAELTLLDDEITFSAPLPRERQALLASLRP